MAEINVQTTVDEVLYESLARLSRDSKMPIKRVVRDAIEDFVRSKSPVEDDPVLRSAGKGRLKERDWSVRKDWRA